MSDSGRAGSRPRLYLDRNLQIIFAVTLMAVLGVSSISPALPVMARALGVSSSAIGLLITAFTLPGVLLTPFLGVLADRWGRKRIIVPSLMLFGIAGGACALARSFELLIVLRLLQGVGAAALGSLNVTLIGDIFHGRDRTAAMGYNGSVLSVGTAAYPAAGGALAVVGWFYPFALALLGVPVGLAVLFFMNNAEPESYAGLRQYLKNAYLGMMNKKVIGLFAASVMTFIILYGSYLTYFPFFMEDRFKAGSLFIGLIMTGGSLVTAAVSWQVGRLSQMFSGPSMIRAAFVFYAAAMVSLPFITHPLLAVFPAMAFGLGMGINIPSILNMLSGLAKTGHRAAFMSINGTLLRLGQTIGPLAMGWVFAARGIEWVFYAGALFAGTAFIMAAVMIRE